MNNTIKLFIFVFILLIIPVVSSIRSLKMINFFSVSESDRIKLSSSRLENKYFIDFINENLINKKALVMRQSDIVSYTDVEFLYIYDERFANMVESSNDLEQFLKILKDNKIEYIVFSFSNDPGFYSTHVQKIIDNPKLSSLVYSDYGTKIFKIVDNDKFKWDIIEKIKFQELDFLCFIKIFTNLGGLNKVLENNTGTLYSSDLNNYFSNDFATYEITFEAKVISKKKCKVKINLLDFKNNNIFYDKDIIINSGGNLISTRLIYNKNNRYSLVIQDFCNDGIVIQDTIIKKKLKKAIPSSKNLPSANKNNINYKRES